MKLRALLLVLLASAPALGYIEALTSLKGVFQESDVIARGTIDAVSVEKKVAILKVGKTAKGKCSYEKIRIDLGAAEGWHGEAALKHAVAGTPVSLFYHRSEKSETPEIALIYLNRFFMIAKPEAEVWRLSKIELSMNKVFHGTAEELNELALKIQSGRSKPPAANAELKPYTREILEALPPPPKEGEKWADFDPAKVFGAK